MTTAAHPTLVGIGIRSQEKRALSVNLDAILDLLGVFDNKFPSRAHPVVRRFVIGCEQMDALDEFDIQMDSDEKVLRDLRKSLLRTRSILHSNPGNGLDALAIQDLGTSLVAIRVYLAWKLNLLGQCDPESSMREILSHTDAHSRNRALVWMWCGLMLSRITGEAAEDDPDFGLS